MKEVLIALAEYNAKANAKLLETLKGADEAKLLADQGSFFKSVVGTVEHIASSEAFMLKRFQGFFPSSLISAEPLLEKDLDGLKALAKESPQAAYALLVKMDALLLAYVKGLDEADLPKRVSFKNYKGEAMERAFWNTVVHILNHGTHHRGEISALLDRQGIANDYSGFQAYMS